MLEPGAGASIETMQDNLGRVTWPKLMTLISGAARAAISGHLEGTPDEEETTCRPVCNGKYRFT